MTEPEVVVQTPNLKEKRKKRVMTPEQPEKEYLTKCECFSRSYC